MMTINEEINIALADCHMRTGKKATNIYLGRSQMARLMRWAKENQYIHSEDAPKEGGSRPEIMGCFVFEVDDESHCMAA